MNDKTPLRNISTRQAIIFYCIYSFSIKFLSLPSLLYGVAGRDAWIGALIGTVAELLILWLVLTYVNKRSETSVYTDLRFWRGTFAKILFAVFAVVFIYELYILTDQTYKLLSNNLFDKVNIFFFAVPLFLMGLFFCFNPSRAVFRSGEVFYIFIILGIIMSVAPAIMKIDATETLPMLDGGFLPPLRAFLQNIVFFESFLFLLIFKGEIQTTRHFKKKFMTVATVLGLFFVFFVFMFISLFGELSQFKDVAITNFTVYSSYITSSGRLDWVLVTMWLLLIILRFGVTFFCAFKSLKYIVRGNK